MADISINLHNTIHNIDGLELLKQIPDHSIDLILTDPPYIIVFALAGFNLLVFILMIAVLSVSSSSPKRGDDEEDDDWMMEFIGTSAEPDMADITGGNLDNSPERDLSESKALDDDDDDLFGQIKSEAKSKKRKDKKSKKSDDDEDDGKSKKRRAVKRRK